MFGRSGKLVVGVDVGVDSVKVVGLRRDGHGYHVVGAAISDIESVGCDSGAGRAGRIVAIESCLREAGIGRNSYFVCGVGGGDVKVSGFDFKSLSAGEVEQAVMFEAAQVCPFDIRQSVVDYQVLGYDGSERAGRKKHIYDSVTGVLAVAKKDAVGNRQMLMEEASLRCVMVDSEGLALLNCLGQCDKGLQGSSAILNVGKEVATVAVLGENGVPFIRDIGYGGVDVVAEKLVGDINETLAYYSMSNGCEKVERIYVCGENSLGDGFAEVLGDGISGDVLAWNPFVHLHCEAAVADAGLVQRSGAALAVAAGLAMREV